jgi:hypothetical protein
MQMAGFATASLTINRSSFTILEEVRMKTMPSLLSLTKLVLAVSALVQLIMTVAAFFLPSLTQNLLSPDPSIPVLANQYIGAFYLAGAIGAAYAFMQDNWIAARTYLAGAFVLIVAFVIITLLGLLSPSGLQPIAWAYVFLSVIYLPVVAWVWRQESARYAAS